MPLHTNPAKPAERSAPAIHSPMPLFSLHDTDSLGCNIRLSTPTIVIGLGSAASYAVSRFARVFTREFGYLPKGMNYLLIDADKRPTGVDFHHFVSLGVDGAGTKPQLGREMLMKNRDKTRKALLGQVGTLFQVDPLLPIEKTAREATAIHIVAGAGGTSGGCLDEMITLVHEVGKQLNIQERRVCVSLIGWEISIQDTSRDVTKEQAGLIPDTYAQNLRKLYADIVYHSAQRERRPGYHMDESERVFSIQVPDKSNGEADFATTDELTHMLGHALFFQTCTHAGMDLAGRVRDHRGCGAHAGITS